MFSDLPKEASPCHSRKVDLGGSAWAIRMRSKSVPLTEDRRSAFESLRRIRTLFAAHVFRARELSQANLSLLLYAKTSFDYMRHRLPRDNARDGPWIFLGRTRHRSKFSRAKAIPAGQTDSRRSHATYNTSSFDTNTRQRVLRLNPEPSHLDGRAV